MRHRDVLLCANGVMAFFLTYHFMCTGELSDFGLDDWLDNKKWFDIKILADINTADKMKRIQNDSYSDRIKETLTDLNCNTSKLLHLGRNLGAKMLDLMEEKKEEKRAMGQWSPDVMDSLYSSKLPMSPMRKLAGFSTSNPMYYNPRTQLMPSESLKIRTQLGAWCYTAYEAVKAASTAAGGKHQTDVQVLKFLCHLNMVFLQDAAATLHRDPERAEHAMYAKIPVLRSTEFLVSILSVQHWLMHTN